MGLSASQNVLQALERGETVLTANEHAARSIRRSWDRRQRSLGHTSWPSALVFSWGAWLRSLWRELLLSGVTEQLLLSSAQEHQIWRAVLQVESHGRRLPGQEALAEMCAEAYRRLRLYDAAERWSALRNTLRGDAALFARWLQLFDRRCGRDRLLPEAALPAFLSDNLDSITAQNLVLVGFDQLTPAQKNLLGAWERRHGSVFLDSAPLPSADGTLLKATDPTAEIRGFARWARRRLEQEPEQRIALATNHLAAEREMVESILRETLDPERQDIMRGPGAMLFEVSLGRTLRAEPLVQAAFDLLRWTRGALAMEQIEALLLGPAIGDAVSERAERSIFLQQLLLAPRLLPEATIAEVLELLQRRGHSPHRLPTLVQALRSVEHAMSSLPDALTQSYGAWAELIRATLEAAQWGRHLSSRAYQILRRWNGVLDTLATLDTSGEETTWPDVSSTLDRLARVTIFAPESHDAPVQVMSPAEAAGSDFDALWIVHAGAADWPGGRSSSPLLPASLEHALGMPGGDREIERRLQRTVMERLAGSAPLVIVSFSAKSLSGAEQRACTEVAGFVATTAFLDDYVTEDPRSPPTPLERMEDAARIQPLAQRAVSGGARVLELQAQCGFRAFAELRLHAGELPSAGFGFSAMELGSSVHRALESIWEQLGSQSALKALTEFERSRLLDQVVARALVDASHNADGEWSRAYLEIQRERVSRLLHRWLRVELLRTPFSVCAQEDKRLVSVGPLDLSVRLDRVDVVKGARVLLDYKTGAAKTGQWLSDRPDRPQLPLYAVFAGTPASNAIANDSSDEVSSAPLGGIAFASVIAGDRMGFEGFEEEGAGLLLRKGRAPLMDGDSFAEQIARWGEIVTRLATEFAEGDARVRPKQFPATCTHCGQRLLCRVDATLFEEHGEAGVEEASEDDG